jgi:hypothetical protein
MRGKREIRVFPVRRRERTSFVRYHLLRRVLPHELGHHEALYRGRVTDGSVVAAERRADLLAPS